jgi:glutathione peroxidase
MIKSYFSLIISAALFVFGCSNPKEQTSGEKPTNEKRGEMNVYGIDVNLLDGSKFNWNTMKGKRLMIVNVASECGLTPQYEQLQAMYAKLDTSRYAILGVPANNFLKQEPSDASDIAAFCTKNYGVEFPILEKMNVGNKVFLSYPPKPEDAEEVETSALYAYLTQKSLNGEMDIDIQWNFQKIFVDENGKVYDFAAPREIDPFVLMDKLAFTN